MKKTIKILLAILFIIVLVTMLYSYSRPDIENIKNCLIALLTALIPCYFLARLYDINKYKPLVMIGIALSLITALLFIMKILKIGIDESVLQTIIDILIIGVVGIVMIGHFLIIPNKRILLKIYRVIIIIGIIIFGGRYLFRDSLSDEIFVLSFLIIDPLLAILFLSSIMISDKYIKTYDQIETKKEETEIPLDNQ